MLTDRALRVASDIISDYERFKILSLLNTAIAASQNRGNNNYDPLVKQVIVGFDEVLKESSFNAYPPDLYGYLNDKNFAPLLPTKLAQRIIAGFSGKPANHINANEVSSILDAANQLLNNSVGFSNFAYALGAHVDEVSEGHFSIDLALPDDVFKGLFSEFIESYKHFDRLFQISAEISGTPREGMVVKRASSSVITTILTAVQEHYLVIISVYSGIVGAAVKTIQLYKTIADLKASKVPKEVLEPVEATREQVRDAYIDEMLENISARLDKIEEGRRNEVRNELRISARYILDDVINGARISLSIENFREAKLPEILQEKTELENQSIFQRIGEIRQLENKIEQTRMGDPETIRAIAKRSDPEK